MSFAHLPVRHLLQQLQEGRSERNRRFQLPKWLETFIERAADCFEPETESARAGYVCSCADDGWYVTLFLGTAEVVGGPDDGARRLTGFQFDLLALRDCFDEIVSIRWLGYPQSCGTNPDSTDESSLIVVGVLNDQPLQLEVTLRPPQEIGPGLLVDADGCYTPAP